MTSKAARRRARRINEKEGENGAEVAAAPRLILDVVVAGILLGFMAFEARASLNPDGVAYLELSAAVVRGDWSTFVQGYWSPGYPLVLAPVVAWLQRDRYVLLLAVHLIQAVIGGGALALSVLAVRRRIPSALQRAAFWVAAWSILRLVSQEFVTPDLLLVTCIVAAIALMSRPSQASQVAIGLLAGAAFLCKTSIWPWLTVAALLACRPAWQAGSWNRAPWRMVTPAALIIGVWLVALSVKEGRPTLGSVGPLNIGWYLGALDRRTADSYQGPHAMNRTAVLPSGAQIQFTDLRTANTTYLPWSQPELWAQGLPADSRVRFSVAQAMRSWRTNFAWSAKFVLPVAIGIAIMVVLSGAPGGRRDVLAWLNDRPLLVTGLIAYATFVIVHVEQRLAAPAVLMASFGALSGGTRTRRPWALRVSSLIFAGLLLGDSVRFAYQLRQTSAGTAAELRSWQDYLGKRARGTARSGIVVVGPATTMMSRLWLGGLHVTTQFSGSSASALTELSNAQRSAWLRKLFGRDARGFVTQGAEANAEQVTTSYTLVTW